MPPKASERDNVKAVFAQRLAKAIADKGWNQSETARAASKFLPKGDEFRRDAISVYLSGQSLPRAKQLAALAKAFDMRPGELLPGGDQTKMPYSMVPVADEPQNAWLQVDMKVPMSTAIAVLGLLNQAQK